MNTIKIRTTQNVEVEYPMASLGDRILAHLVDLVVYFAWGILMVIVLRSLDAINNISLTLAVLIPILFYHLLCEVLLNGQSVGKMALDIKVIKLSGEAPGIGDYLLRWMFRLVDTGVSNGLVAIITIAASQNGQRFGDMSAGTCVIKKKAVRRKDRFSVRVEEGYQIRFPEANMLTDKDVALIRTLLYKAKQHKNYALLGKISERVKDTTGIQTEMDDWRFLQTILKDYYHYTHGEVTVS